MKILIENKKIESVIYNYIDEMIDFDEIHWSPIYDYDGEGYEHENENLIEYYYGDYDSEDGDFLFDYISPEYYGDYPSEKHYKDKSPILELRHEEIYNTLEGLFGEFWEKPFKEWFEDKFNLPVNTVTIHIQ